MRRKLIVVCVVVLGSVIAFMTLRAPPPELNAKIDGDVYVLPKAFLINLAEQRYAKLSVALIIPHGEGIEAGGEGGEEGAATPPEGYGALEQEAVVRSIVTDVLSDQPSGRLLQTARRAALKRGLLNELEQRSDVHATGVLFTDLVVQ